MIIKKEMKDKAKVVLRPKGWGAKPKGSPVRPQPVDPGQQRDNRTQYDQLAEAAG